MNGDTLVLVTDGVLEAHSGDVQFDVSGVERVLTAETGDAAAVGAGCASGSGHDEHDVR